MIFLAMLLVVGIAYAIAAIATRLNLLPGRKRRAADASSRGRPAAQTRADDATGEGSAWTALDELQLKRLLKDSAS